MSLAPGFRLGSYEIVAAIGAGGMGEVYRARDTRLNRDVAIKVLPDLFAQDPERLARGSSVKHRSSRRSIIPTSRTCTALKNRSLRPLETLRAAPSKVEGRQAQGRRPCVRW